LYVISNLILVHLRQASTKESNVPPPGRLQYFKHKMSLTIQQSSRRSQNPRSARRHSSKTGPQSPELSITITLIAVALAFISLRLPYTIAYYLHEYRTTLWKPGELNDTLRIRLFSAVKMTDVIAISNYFINFFLYALCGSDFRKHACNVLRCGRKYKAKIPAEIQFLEAVQNARIYESERNRMLMRGQVLLLSGGHSLHGSESVFSKSSVTVRLTSLSNNSSARFPTL